VLRLGLVFLYVVRGVPWMHWSLAQPLHPARCITWMHLPPPPLLLPTPRPRYLQGFTVHDRRNVTGTAKTVGVILVILQVGPWGAFAAFRFGFCRPVHRPEVSVRTPDFGRSLLALRTSFSGSWD
jgi:hypothetical protein